MSITRTGILAAGTLGTAALLAACGTPTVSKTPAAPVPSSFTPAAEPAAVPSSSAPDNTGPLGTSFTVTMTGDSGNPVSYTIVLTKVDQHAGLAPYEAADNPADHMAAARFTITGVTGQSSDDANSDASATGSDTTQYPASFAGVTDGPNFSSGEFRVSPGQTVSGWVSFEVPPGARVASVSWDPQAGFGTAAATWDLSS